MKANELRIGNLISWISSGDIEKVMKIDVKHVNEVRELDLKPILLTEEWLVKFGFEFHDYDLFDDLSDDFEEEDSKYTMLTYKLKHPRFKRIWIGLDFYEEDEYCQVYSFNPLKKNNDGRLYHDYIEFVNQLQNLYFSLTGEELELKQD